VVVLKQGVAKATLEQVVAECNKTRSSVEGDAELTVHDVTVDNEGIVTRREVSREGEVALEEYLKSEKQ
jgi:hypothetical protein